MFGALVTVTGPTVIAPLVRATRLNDHVRAVLLGEGVLIDPLGAILVLQFALSRRSRRAAWWLWRSRRSLVRHWARSSAGRSLPPSCS